MATYQELRARSQQVRDEQNIGGNTALRVGQLLMDIVKYFNDNDEAASEYLQQHFAMVNDGTQLLNWQQSPIVILHTMGETYDDGDYSSLSQGENYYRRGFIVEANGQGGGINGETPKANVLYVNLSNDTLYTWNGSSFDAITSGGGGGSISGDDIIKNAYYSNGNLVLIIETEGGDKMVTIPVTFDASNYVPTSRTVNGKALSNNITISQSDIPGLVAALAAKVGYSDGEWLQVKAGAMQAASAVPNTTTVNGKQLNDNIVIGMADIPGLLQAIANAGSGAVSVIQPDPADGTFIIRVGSTDYTINLNHTHENMAKLVKCTEATLPQTMADDTIYVQVDNLTTPTEIEKLYLFGLEFTGGGIPDTGEPMISSPSNGSTINLGDNTDGQGVSKVITIKGKNLTGDLTVAVGTGLTISYGQSTGQSSVTIPMAQALLGVQVTISYSGTGALDDGSLVISHGGSVLSSVVVVVVVVSPVALTAIKLTGSQWLRTDYYINPNTEFRMELKFTANGNTTTPNAVQSSEVYVLSANYNPNNSGSDNFKLNTGIASSSSTVNNAYLLIFKNKTSNKFLGTENDSNWRANVVTDHAILSYAKAASKGVLTFNGASAVSVDTDLAIDTLANPLDIGYNAFQNGIFKTFDLTIYSFIITEGGVEKRHYVPATFNGVPGLHDTVTDTFISSETSTPVVAIQ